MRTIKEITDQMVEVQNFVYSLEKLRKMHAICTVNIVFNGHSSMNPGSEENLTLAIKRAAIEYQTEIVVAKANDLKLSGIDPGEWWKEFKK